MRVILINPEETLLSHLSVIEAKSTPTLCVVVQASLIKNKTSRWDETLKKSALECFGHPDGILIRRDNDDVFMFSNHITRKEFNKFITQINDTLDSEYERSSSLYELPLQIETIKALVSPEKRKSLPDLPSIVLPDSLIQSLNDRRMSREQTLVQFVDDDGFVQKLLYSSTVGTSLVKQSTTGKSAIEDYVTMAPDIIFLDIGLPDINGQKVLKSILDVDPSAYIIMLSGKGDRDTVLESVKIGAKGFIGKPFTRQKLFSYIQNSPHVQYKINPKDWVFSDHGLHRKAPA